MMQFQITSRPRHLRYLYFVDEKYPYDKLFALIHANQMFWGGRYNPIVPVKGNVISESYVALIKNYDPDYVFYSTGIDPEIIKRLRIFNPLGYFNLDEQPRQEDITGVYAYYFLPQFPPNSKLLSPVDIWKTENPLLDFYKINFGLESSPIRYDYEAGKNQPQKIDIDVKNFGSLNQIIQEQRPINQAQLSSRNLNTRILRNLENARYNSFEIVVSKDKSSIVDLFYFWNRLLYEAANIVYTTIEELNLLSQDKFFGGVLYDMNFETTIQVGSMTLSREEILEIIKLKLSPVAPERRFEYKDLTSFPFVVLDANGLYEREYGESQTSEAFISAKGLLHLPKLSFVSKVGVYPQKWAIDFEIKKFGDSSQNQLKFPHTTETQYIIKGVKGRINKNRSISVFIHSQHNTSDFLEFDIPELKELLPQLISRPIINGIAADTKYIDIGRHDSSNKLSAFLKSFNYEFRTINDFFTDKFWVDLFEDLITNERIAGEAIIFDEIKLRCIEALKRKGIVLGKREDTYQNEENLELGLKRTIKELCSYRVFIRGFNLKCRKCSSEFWYHIKDVGEVVNCKGCLEDFEIPIEPKFAYKLNDLIKNNIFQSKKSRDGNLTVIRTLACLYASSRQSFEYSPQINLYDNHHSNKPCAEIDIVCISDGNLIIGEAKHNSAGFSAESNKSLVSLVEVAKMIRPDKVILSCYEDSSGKLEKAKQGLVHYFHKWEYQPEIETMLLDQPDDFDLGEHRYFYY